MSHSDLFEPLVFRNGARARNRIVLAPMTNQQSHDDGSLADAELHWLQRRALGGFGTVETCAAQGALLALAMVGFLLGRGVPSPPKPGNAGPAQAVAQQP